MSDKISSCHVSKFFFLFCQRTSAEKKTSDASGLVSFSDLSNSEQNRHCIIWQTEAPVSDGAFETQSEKGMQLPLIRMSTKM